MNEPDPRLMSGEEYARRCFEYYTLPHLQAKADRLGISFNFPTLKGWGLRMDRVMFCGITSYLRDWVVEGTRAQCIQTFQPDVLRSVFVRVGRVTTPTATKVIAGLAILFVGVATFAASLGREVRVNFNDRDSRHFGFVGNESSKLRETPTVLRGTLSFSSLYPAANTSEFFNGNRTTGAFSERDNLFGNDMVGIPDEPEFTATPLLQKPLGGFSADALQFAAQGEIPVPNLVQGVPAEFIAVTVGGDNNNAKVDSENVGGLLFHCIWQNNGHGQEEFAVPAQHQVGLLNQSTSENLALVFAADERDALAFPDRPDGRLLFVEKDFQTPNIERHAAVRPELPLRLFVNLVGVSNLREDEAGSLCAHIKDGPDIVVVPGLESELCQHFTCEPLLRHPVRRLVASLQGRTQDHRLFGRRPQFQLDCNRHLFSIIEPTLFAQPGQVAGNGNNRAALKGGDSTRRSFVEFKKG